jgi:hypothetical protein
MSKIKTKKGSFEWALIQLVKGYKVTNKRIQIEDFSYAASGDDLVKFLYIQEGMIVDASSKDVTWSLFGDKWSIYA